MDVEHLWLIKSKMLYVHGTQLWSHGGVRLTILLPNDLACHLSRAIGTEEVWWGDANFSSDIPGSISLMSVAELSRRPFCLKFPFRQTYGVQRH